MTTEAEAKAIECPVYCDGKHYWNIHSTRPDMCLCGAKEAPPSSPPAAVEPAQEAGGVERETHPKECTMYDYCSGRCSEHSEKIGPVCKWREQSEREATELRTRLEMAIGNTRTALSDRDAERTQKEALRVEMEEAKARLENQCIYNAELTKQRDNYWRLLCEKPLGSKPSKQPAEAAPVAKLCDCGHHDDDHHSHEFQDGYCSKCSCSSYQVAAPVAKGEATAEPAVWVQKCEPCGGDGFTGCAWGTKETCQACGGLGHVPAEPAPQPPATTGGDSERGVLVVKSPRQVLSDASGFVTRAELVTALGACRGRLGGSASALAGMLADELEKRQP